MLIDFSNAMTASSYLSNIQYGIEYIDVLLPEHQVILDSRR